MENVVTGQVSLLTQRFWHCAVSPDHQSIAVASYFQAAQQAGVRIYDGCDSQTEIRVQRIAEWLNVPVQRPGYGRDGQVLISTETSWWWIGTHNPAGSSRCSMVWTSVLHPRVSLCLFLAKDADLMTAPSGHVPYITGKSV